MSESICRFMTAKNEDTSIQVVRFVYETECLSLKQPFMHPIYVFHIVTKGLTIWMQTTNLNIFISALWAAARPRFCQSAA